MDKPRLLDLFCGAGGCTKGYQRAGFYVVGVDIKPQPHYCGDEFYQYDALTFLRAEGSAYDAIHASPPCQGYSTLAAMHPGREYPKLIDAVRDELTRMWPRVPYVIENVETAPLDCECNLLGNGVLLCGSMFGLGVSRGYLRRHRIFETSFPVAQPRCAHAGVAVGVYGHGGHSGKHRMLYRKEAAEAMKIDWMSRDEMAQAIPPAYTEFIGKQLMRVVRPATSDSPSQIPLTKVLLSHEGD